jgi:hypothetical protein
VMFETMEPAVKDMDGVMLCACVVGKGHEQNCSPLFVVCTVSLQNILNFYSETGYT